jgi:2'-5' RNA ligase
VTRLFVALRPPEAIRDRLLDTMDGIDGARWQDEDQLHLTLRFVGEVDPPVAEDLAAALGGIEAAAFELAVAGVGHFQTRGRPTALWAKPLPSPALADLQRKVERVCQRVGLEPEHRKFTPHITLARLNRAAGPVGGWLAAHGTLAAGPWRVDEFRLYESALAPGGARYEPVVSYRLRG